MADLYNTFFGVLGKEWCSWYFLLVIFTLVLFILSVITAVVSLFNIKKFNLSTLYLLLIPVLINAVLYMQSRIIHSICISSLR